jgi:diadenylate cyclase
VVAFIIYELLVVVRGTRAAHILVGIITVLVVYIGSLWAGLDALRSLLSYIVPYTAIAAVVLFQSEIRRTLARIGRKRWTGRGFRRPESTPEILMAVKILAEAKVGALIVLERDTGLRTFVESGVPMDAQISRDLFLAIFKPDTPLHDGAVIIQKDRLSAAACFLPLSTNPLLPPELGTRHRAGLGITEETDCLSLIVSEESGQISIAAFGALRVNLTTKEVDDFVSSHFGVEKPKSAATGQPAAARDVLNQLPVPAPQARDEDKAAYPKAWRP